MTTSANHIVICGYDAGARMLLDAIPLELDPEKWEIILFSSGERPPEIPSFYVWVSGDPTKESELDKVRLTHASAVIVVGSRTLLPQQADAITILTIFTIRSYLRRHPMKRKRPVYIVAEILEAENVEHAKTAGADEVVETTRLGFSRLAHAVAMPGTSAIMSRVATSGALSVFVGKVPEEIPPPADFASLSSQIKRRYSALVIGVCDAQNGNYQLNPENRFSVQKHHRLIYLAASPVLPEH